MPIVIGVTLSCIAVLQFFQLLVKSFFDMSVLNFEKRNKETVT
jgi:hypothetical protein